MKAKNEIVERLERIESLLTERREKPLTLEEAAEYLDISTSYLYKLTSVGKVPHYKPSGKRIYFLESELCSYLLQNRVKSQREIEEEATNRVVSTQPGHADQAQS